MKMPLAMLGKSNSQEPGDTMIYRQHTCRIPQRLPSARRPNFKTPSEYRPAQPGHKKNANVKAPKQVITVPVRQNNISKPSNRNRLPSQETIQKFENLIVEEDYYTDNPGYNDMDEIFLDFNEKESVTSKHDKVMQLKTVWQEKIVQYERIKRELNDRQKAILEVYSSLRSTKDELTSLGQNANLPSTDDLRIMNVANMTPQQLLQLCEETRYITDISKSGKSAITVDIKKLNDMPSKLIAVCEQVLATRTELIEWFDNLKNQEKVCNKSTLSKKINEFKAETEIVNNSIQTIKKEFVKEVSDILRACCEETIASQQRNKDLTYDLKKLNSQNIDLKKRISHYEQQKMQVNKLKFEELLKELKEEKEKAQIFKHRLTRAEGLVKSREERVTSLEAALEQARIQTRNLERTVQQLHEQNQRLQKDFDDELNKLKESMEKNTKQLKEIAHARETLQSEKECFKEKLMELTNHYHESLDNVKSELNQTASKMIDVEKKYKEQLEEKKNLQTKVESLSKQLVESELRYKDTLEQLKEAKLTLNEMMRYKNELEEAKRELDGNKIEIEKNGTFLKDQQELLEELKENFQRSQKMEEKLNCEVNSKAEYIKELEEKLFLLHQKYQENESKVAIYEEQLYTLKNHITNLKEHYGEFENLNDLNEMINQQKSQLREKRHQNEELSTELQKKQNELKNLAKTISEHEDYMKQRHGILQMLSEKAEEEYSNNLLRDKEIHQKNDEIESLDTNIENKKQHITQLEKIILTMEDHNRKTSIQNKKDQDRIHTLEKKIEQYESYINNKNMEAPVENLDNLIKILEDEIGTPLDSQTIAYNNKFIQNENFYDHNEYKTLNKNIPAKIVMGNFVKKTYIQDTNDRKGDNLDRKQAITNIDAQKWMANLDASISGFRKPSFFNDSFLPINEMNSSHRRIDEHLINNNRIAFDQGRLDKKSKMFKFAGHRV